MYDVICYIINQFSPDKITISIFPDFIFLFECIIYNLHIKKEFMKYFMIKIIQN